MLSKDKPNILLACEYSAITRAEFEKVGFNAVSADLLPTERPGKHHQGDVREILHLGFDAIIAFPPCTYLSNVGRPYWNQPGRAAKRIEALQFVLDIMSAPIRFKAIENPMGIIDHVIRKHDQIIHPYYFGGSEMKRTCLWLENLPKLVHHKTDLFSPGTHAAVPEPIVIEASGKRRHRTEMLTKAHDRNRGFPEIAAAMAQQWGGYIKQQLSK